MKKFFIVYVFLMGTSVARADMYSALQDVYESNPVIGESRAAVRAAAAELGLAKTQVLPYVGAAAGTGFARTKIGDATFGYEPTQFGIEAQQNLFQGFSVVAQIKAARSALAAQESVLYATQQEVFLDAINAYIDVLNAREVLELNKSNQRVLQEYYDFCVARQQVGALTQTDVAQASARLEMARFSVADATAAYNNTLETFRRIYGTVLDAYPDIDMQRVSHLFPQSAAGAQDYAVAHHPTIVALEAQRDAARSGIVSAHKTILPSVDMRASVMQVDDVPVLDHVRDSRVGVYLKLPLFDRGMAVANVEKARTTVDGIDEKIIHARRVIVENLNSAWNIYDAQTTAISAGRARKKANQLALDGTREEQKRGRRTVLDVLNAQQELLNAQVALTRAEHAQVSAFFAILAAMGKLNPSNLGME